MLVDRNGISCFIDRNGVTSFVDENGLTLSCGAPVTSTDILLGQACF